jgi:hypothetical protein
MNEQFCCGNMEKVRFGYRYIKSAKLSVFFKQNKGLARQKILPGDSKNSTSGRAITADPRGHD